MIVDLRKGSIVVETEEEKEALLDVLRPRGEWKKCSLGFDCNKCGYTQIYEGIICEYHFCPNCGADMRERKSDNEQKEGTRDANI